MDSLDGSKNHHIWTLDIGTEITLRCGSLYPKAILCSEMVPLSEPVLMRLCSDDTKIEIVYATACVMANVPPDTHFYFVKHMSTNKYVIEGKATHSGHICLGVDGPDTHNDTFTLACKHAIAYTREQRMLADAIVVNARKRAREIIADAETQVDDPRTHTDWYGQRTVLHKHDT